MKAQTKWWMAAALLAAPVVSLAQTDEIQVYDANIAEKGKFNLMIHNNFTPVGLKSRRFRGLLNRITRWWELRSGLTA